MQLPQHNTISVLPFLQSSLQCFAALDADTALGAVLVALMTYAGRLLAAGADDLNLRRVHRALSLDDAAGLAHTAGLDVLRHDVDLLDDDLALRGRYREDLALLALVLTA